MSENENAHAFDMSAFEDDAAYNPLEFIEGEDDEDWQDSDAALLPSQRSEIGPAKRPMVSVFSPERTGSVNQALRSLVETNAARRPILLAILEWSRNGIAASELFARIDEEQSDNLSVYEPASYCRMLQRTGALELVLEAASTDEDTQAPAAEEAGSSGLADAEAHTALLYVSEEEQGGISDTNTETDITAYTDAPEVQYRTITTHVEPLWRTTEAGHEALAQLVRGDEFRDRILDGEAIYSQVYLALMQLLSKESQPRNVLVDLAETFEVTIQPRRWGAHFLDMLEATGAIRWSNKNEKWSLTDLGKDVLPELEAQCFLHQDGEQTQSKVGAKQKEQL